MTASAVEQRIAREGVPGAWCGDTWIPGRAPGERRNLTDRQKQAILEWVTDHSWSEALTAFGVSSAAIVSWRRQQFAPPVKRRHPRPKPAAVREPVGSPDDRYGCVCGDRYPTHLLLAHHITHPPKHGSRQQHRRDPNDPADSHRLVGTVRAGTIQARSDSGQLDVRVVRPRTANYDYNNL